MFVFQGNQNDCGFASLKMMLANAHKDSNYLYLKNERNDKYSLSDLINLGKKYGLTLTPYKINNIEGLLELKGMFLATTNIDNYKHMVFVKKVCKNTFYVYDPSTGKKRIKHNDFYDDFDGEILLLEEGYPRIKCETKKERILPVKNELGIIVLEFFSLSSIIVALSSIAYGAKTLTTLLLFLAYVIFELVSQYVLKKSMKEYDKQYLVKLKSLKRDEIVDSYSLIQQQKKHLFSSPIQLIVCSLIFASSLVTLSANGLIYLEVFLASTILITLIYIGSKKYIDKRTKMLEENEQKILKGKDVNIDDFVDESYSIVGLLSIKKFLLVFLALSVSILLMFLEKKYELNYVLFYFFFYFFAFNKLSDGVDYLLNSDEREKVDAKFRDKFF